MIGLHFKTYLLTINNITWLWIYFHSILKNGIYTVFIGVLWFCSKKKIRSILKYLKKKLLFCWAAQFVEVLFYEKSGVLKHDRSFFFQLSEIWTDTWLANGRWMERGPTNGVRDRIGFPGLADGIEWCNRR